MTSREVTKEITETNDSLIAQVKSLSNSPVASSEAMVYKLLLINVATLSRLSKLYESKGELVNQGRTQAALDAIKILYQSNIKASLEGVS